MNDLVQRRQAPFCLCRRKSLYWHIAIISQLSSSSCTLSSRQEQWFSNSVYFEPWAVVPQEIAFESFSRNLSREMLVNFDLRSPTNMLTSSASIDGKWKVVWPICIYVYIYICNLVFHVEGFGIMRFDNCNILHTTNER